MRQSLPRRTKQALICLLLLWISGGCYLPIQQIPTDARENMPAGSLNFEPGVSSRSDVLLHMGEPDEISSDEAVFTYRWPSIDGIIVVTQCTPPIEIDSETAITYYFDNTGLLQKVDVTRT